MVKRKKHLPEVPRLSRRWWLGVVRNSIWVVIVTVLVWVYADMEFTDTSPDQRVTIHLTPGKQGLMLLGKTDVQVSFRAQGNRSSLAAFTRWLKERGMVLEYDVSEEHAFARGSVSVPTLTVLERITELTRRGLTVAAVDPAAITFQLEERLQILGVPVKVEFTGGNAVVDQPAKVNIYVAKSAWAKVSEDKRVLRTKPVDLKNLPADGQVSAEIIPSIVLADGTNVPVEPEHDSVKVQVKVEKLTDVKKLTVPVRIEAPMSWTEDNTWSDYKFVLKPGESRTIDLEIEGTKADLDSLTPADVDAYIVLQDSDKTPVESWLPGKVSVNLLKPNLKLVGERPKLNYKLLKREPTPK